VRSLLQQRECGHGEAQPGDYPPLHGDGTLTPTVRCSVPGPAGRRGRSKALMDSPDAPVTPAAEGLALPSCRE